MTLEELFNRGKEFAKMAFDNQGYIVPMWIYETEDGVHVPFSVPIHLMQDKEAVATMLIEKFKKEKAVRYVSLLESWIVTKKTRKEVDEVLKKLGDAPVSELPDRKEAIFVIAEDKYHNRSGLYFINRDKEGNPTLSEFQDDGEITEHEGLFSHLISDGQTIQ